MLTVVEDAPAKPAIGPRCRTITLPGRAPIKIIEDDWPVIAKGQWGDEPGGAPWGWNVTIHVRHEKYETDELMIGWTRGGRWLIHAKYLCFNENELQDNEVNYTVRVGRLLECGDGNLWMHISEVADELRERIFNDKHRKQVVHAIDACFASLPPCENG